jgi:DHA1 family tetracycline resistance protein-like MFS transporter
MGITGIIGPVLFTQIYAYFLRPHGGMAIPGAPFFCGALLLVMAIAMAVHATRHEPAPVTAPPAAPAAS